MRKSWVQLGQSEWNTASTTSTTIHSTAAAVWDEVEKSKPFSLSKPRVLPTLFRTYFVRFTDVGGLVIRTIHNTNKSEYKIYLFNYLYIGA